MNDPRCDDLVEYAIMFTSVRTSGEGDEKKFSLRRGAGDLLHVMGYYFEEKPLRLQGLSLPERLKCAAEAIKYIADHLDDPPRKA